MSTNTNSLLDGYYDLEPFAPRVGRHPRTVRRWINQADGLPYVKLGNRILIRRESAESWIRAQERKPNPRRQEVRREVPAAGSTAASAPTHSNSSSLNHRDPTREACARGRGLKVADAKSTPSTFYTLPVNFATPARSLPRKDPAHAFPVLQPSRRPDAASSSPAGGSSRGRPSTDVA